MYELTLIERHNKGSAVITHIPCSDHDVDSYVEQLIENEEACVKGHLLVAYTLIAHFEQFNNVRNYQAQKNMAVRL